MNVTIVPLYASILAIQYLFLTLNVVRQRRSNRIGLGSGGNETMQRAIRAHANFIEYVPFALILFLLLELQGPPALWLHVLGVSLIIGRTLHFFGLTSSSGISFGRFHGSGLTFLNLLILAIWNIVCFFKVAI